MENTPQYDVGNHQNATSPTFTDSYKQLENIANQLKSGEMSIDQLVPAVRAAGEAKKVCDKILSDVKAELEKMNAQTPS
jgi:exodeoxyribonuclease VII small subunit